MQSLANPYRGLGLDQPDLAAFPFPKANATGVLSLLDRCPRAAETPLAASEDLATAAGVAAVLIKDERGRMGLGSFKALGAAHVIACDAQAGRAAGRTYVTASAGNHGLSVAAGAAAFGASARVYIAETVPETFAERLRAEGATVVRTGATYEASMASAEKDAAAEGLDLLSDSSWAGYSERPHVLMEGYLAMMAEVANQVRDVPTHVLVQAGVGGLAGAVAAHVRATWGDAPRIVVVEPDVAPALFASIKAGAPVTADGPVSAMGRLDCKTPSFIALKGLARDADDFVTITESEAAEGTSRAAAAGFASTPSGAAGLSALFVAKGACGLGPDSRVLVFLTEAPEG